jgi:hypothetical protein
MSAIMSNSGSSAPDEREIDPDTVPPMDDIPPDPDTVPPIEQGGQQTKPDETRPPDGGPAKTGNENPPTNPPTDPKPPVTRPPREREQDLVESEICADTGMRASIYCPETVTRRFARGQEPQRKCSKHGSFEH